jgi:hypothetical protein
VHSVGNWHKSTLWCTVRKTSNYLSWVCQLNYKYRIRCTVHKHNRLAVLIVKVSRGLTIISVLTVRNSQCSAPPLPPLRHRTVSQPFPHGLNPQIIFHIPRNPHLWKRLQARKKLIEQCAVQLLLKYINSGYVPKSANIIRTRLNNFYSLSRGIWHCSRYFILSELWCHEPTVSGGTPVWETVP